VIRCRFPSECGRAPSVAIRNTSGQAALRHRSCNFGDERSQARLGENVEAIVARGAVAPSATLTPARFNAAIGAMPLASFRFDVGQCTT